MPQNRVSDISGMLDGPGTLRGSDVNQQAGRRRSEKLDTLIHQRCVMLLGSLCGQLGAAFIFGSEA